MTDLLTIGNKHIVDTDLELELDFNILVTVKLDWIMEGIKYVHRDINWCDFNARVLAEAKDPSLPLLDRIKFLAIFSSNLDEFFRVKVAALTKLKQLKNNKAAKWLGYDPGEVIHEIFQRVTKQQVEFGRIWREDILPSLQDQHYHIYQSADVQKPHVEEINKYFRVQVQGYINIGISKHISLKNGAIYLVTLLRKRGSKKSILGFVNIPATELPRFKELGALDGINYIITLDDIIRMNIATLFEGYEILSNSYSIKLNRDEDYEIEDEFSGNLVNKIKEKIERRTQGNPVRLLFDGDMPESMQVLLRKRCGVSDEEMFVGGRYHNLNDYFQLVELLGKNVRGQHLPPFPHAALNASPSVLTAMREKDYLLHFPYHRYDDVLRFFNEAAVDPSVKEIKVTLYRISKKSKIAHALISAALNGKKVTVFVEVKARYDELNNLQWANDMEKAGVAIIYSLPGLKVHAKVALVTRLDSAGKKVRLAYLSTGNFNEKTASIYADHGMLTARKEVTRELELLFKFLKTRSRKIKFGHLLVAGFNMKKRLIGLINQEIGFARKGKTASIIIKLNGLDEQEMIAKLYEASAAGVKIKLIVRAGCSLVAGIKGLSENISAYRLVDMYLEHARVYWFHNNGDDQIYLSSADWMNRNLNRRIEVGFPIVDKQLKAEIKSIIEFQLADNVKLSPITGTDKGFETNGTDNKRRAQFEIHRWVEQKESINLVEQKS